MSARLVIAMFFFTLAIEPGVADEAKVSIDNFTFNPAELTVKAGTVITFENGDDIPHSVVDADSKFHSPPLDTGEKFTKSFDVAGEINYACGLHPHMKGKIIVTP